MYEFMSNSANLARKLLGGGDSNMTLRSTAAGEAGLLAAGKGELTVVALVLAM